MKKGTDIESFIKDNRIYIIPALAYFIYVKFIKAQPVQSTTLVTYDENVPNGVILGGGSTATVTSGATNTQSGLAIVLANKLYNAMESTGTDETAITEVLDKVKGKVSLLRAVYNAYGTKPYSLYGSPTAFFKGTEYDLKNWLKSELSTKTYNYWLTEFNTAGII